MKFLPALIVLATVLVLGCPEDSVTDEGPDAVDDVAQSDGTGTPSDDVSGTEDSDVPAVVQVLDDGEACETDAECASGRCLGEDEGFPGGLCSTVGCTEREDCQGVGRACLRGEFNGDLCVALCSSDEDCRPDYECHGGEGGYCYPAFSAAALEAVCDSELIEEDAIRSLFYPPLDHHRLSFDVSEDAHSFAVVVYNREEPVYPVSLTVPSGDVLGLTSEYGYFMRTGLLVEHISPMMIPAGPQWTSWVQGGHYTLDVGTSGESVCHFVLENEGPGTVIDLNFYFVGVPGLSSATADTDPDFAEMVDEFRDTMAAAEVSLGKVRYFDVTGNIEDAFTIIRTEAEVYELMSLSRAPGQSLEDLLSVNVFFIQDFTGAMFSTLGVAAGIPGVMGVHGQEGTGLIFSASNLGRRGGNVLVGQVLAHEVGHFLGLEHTTEIAIRDTYDHLDDTPRCDNIRRDNLEDCPDYENLMFPVAGFRDDVSLTSSQTLVIRSNPLVRPE